MKSPIALLIACVFIGTAMTTPAKAEEVVIDVSMPEIILAGVANPFPAAYYFSADKHLLAYGIGKEAEFFEDQKTSLSGTVSPAMSEATEVSRRDFLFGHLKAKSTGTPRYRVFFLTIHPAMGVSPTCEKLLAELRRVIAASKLAKSTDLIILRASG